MLFRMVVYDFVNNDAVRICREFQYAVSKPTLGGLGVGSSLCQVIRPERDHAQRQVWFAISQSMYRTCILVDCNQHRLYKSFQASRLSQAGKTIGRFSGS
jgi:hypothetical protein